MVTITLLRRMLHCQCLYIGLKWSRVPRIWRRRWNYLKPCSFKMGLSWGRSLMPYKDQLEKKGGFLRRKIRSKGQQWSLFVAWCWGGLNAYWRKLRSKLFIVSPLRLASWWNPLKIIWGWASKQSIVSLVSADPVKKGKWDAQFPKGASNILDACI